MAFRLDGAGSLVAFAGHNCQKVAIDGREFVFASRPVSLAAWAPVLPQRRVPGGAVMEVWVHGEAAMSLPLPGEESRAGNSTSREGALGPSGPKSLVIARAACCALTR